MRILILFAIVIPIWGQSNSLQLCDQQATRHCLTLKAPAAMLNSPNPVTLSGNNGGLLVGLASTDLSILNGAVVSADALVSATAVSNASTGSLTAVAGNYVALASARSSGSATYLPLTLWTSATERMRVTVPGLVGIGTTNPDTLLHTSGTTGIKEQVFGAASLLDNYQAEGTSASPTATTNGRQIGGYRAFGYDGSVYALGADINSQADGAWTGTNHGAFIRFRNTPNGSTTGSEAMRITGPGLVGIGTPSPTVRLTVSSNTAVTLPAPLAGTIGHFLGADNDNTRVAIEAFNGTPVLQFRTSGGTGTTPTATLANQTLGLVAFFGRGSTVYSPSSRAGIFGVAAQNWTDTVQGTYLTFNTTPIGSTTQAERVRITDAGLVGIGTATPLSSLETRGNVGIYLNTASSSGTPVSASLYLGDNYFSNSTYYNSAPGISAIYDPNTVISSALAFYISQGLPNTRLEVMRMVMATPSALLIGGTVDDTTGSVLQVTGSITLDSLSSAVFQCLQITPSGVIQGTGAPCAGGSGTVTAIAGTLPIVSSHVLGAYTISCPTCDTLNTAQTITAAKTFSGGIAVTTLPLATDVNIVATSGHTPTLGSATAGQAFQSLYLTTSFIMNGTTRMDSSGNITVNNVTTAGTTTLSALTSGASQCLQVSSSGVISGTGATCGSGSGAVSSLTATSPIAVSASTGPVNITCTTCLTTAGGQAVTLTETFNGGIITGGNITPSSNNTLDLGTTTNNFRNLIFGTSLIQGSTTRIDNTGSSFMVNSNFTTSLIQSGTTRIDSSGNGTFLSVTAGTGTGTIVSLFDHIHTNNLYAAGIVFLPLVSGPPSCSTITDGATRYDSTNNILYICQGGTARAH